jgi:hypothetical protein
MDGSLYHVRVKKTALLAFDSALSGGTLLAHVEDCLAAEGIGAVRWNPGQDEPFSEMCRKQCIDTDFVLCDITYWRKLTSARHADAGFQAGIATAIERPLVLTCVEEEASSDILGSRQCVRLASKNGKPDWARFDRDLTDRIRRAEKDLILRPFERNVETRISVGGGHDSYQLLDFLDLMTAVTNIECSGGNLIAVNPGLERFLDEDAIHQVALAFAPVLAKRDFSGKTAVIGREDTRKPPEQPAERVGKLAADLEDLLLRRAASFREQVKLHEHTDVYARDFFEERITATDFQYMSLRLTRRQKLHVLGSIRDLISAHPKTYKLAAIAEDLPSDVEDLVKNATYYARADRDVERIVIGKVSWNPGEVKSQLTTARAKIPVAAKAPSHEDPLELVNAAIRELEKPRGIGGEK